MSQIIIKKYPNRRLYDTSIGEYITLEDVKKMVFERVDFKVIDARTKKDLTQSTLLQIIAEQEATSNPIFTTAVLQDFIRFYQEKSQDAFGRYLEQMMNIFTQQRSFITNQWQSYQKLFDPEFLQQFMKTQKPWPEDPAENESSNPIKKRKKSDPKKNLDREKK